MTLVSGPLGFLNVPAVGNGYALLSLLPSALKAQLDFLLTITDPLFGLQRMAAEVLGVVEEAPGVKSLVLRPPARWQGFEPGQYVNIELDIDGVRYRRNYSISSAKSLFEREGLFSITVKQVPGGLVSEYVQQHVKAGSYLYISEAKGQFILPPLAASAPVFVAAGSGITPVMAMLEALAEKDALDGAELIYIVRTRADVIFADRLRKLSEQYKGFQYSLYFSDERGRAKFPQLLKDIDQPTCRKLYICGPEGMMQSAQKAALKLGFRPSDIASESFGLSNLNKTKRMMGEVASASSSVHCELSGKTLSGKTLSGHPPQTLLELAERAGLKPKYGCRSGICHECSCLKSSGRVLNLKTGTLVPEEQRMVQACISVPIDDVSIANW